MLEVILSMGAFAVSIGPGSKGHTRGLGLKACLYFGTFQALIPFIGYPGGKMIYESTQKGVEEIIGAVTHKAMLLLAIATRIDAMAASFRLTLLQIDAWLACAIIGTTSSPSS